MEIDYYHLDTFTDRLFAGNPAGVCVLYDWLSDDILQQIAKEINQPQTAFITQRDGGYHIRWFTPIKEIDACGHSTLAAAYVILNEIDSHRDGVIFQSASGALTVTECEAGYALDFPAYEYSACDIPEKLQAALQVKPQEVYCANSYLVILENERQVRNLTPDYRILSELDLSSVIISARGDHNIDFVSRYFSPSRGVNEDYVTASAFCLLIPYWAEKLAKTKLRAKQVSERPGEVQCELKGERVILLAKVVPLISGKLRLID